MAPKAAKPAKIVSHSKVKPIIISTQEQAAGPIVQTTRIPLHDDAHAHWELAAYPFEPPNASEPALTTRPGAFLLPHQHTIDFVTRNGATLVDYYALNPPNYNAAPLPVPTALDKSAYGRLFPTGMPVQYSTDAIGVEHIRLELGGMLYEDPAGRLDYDQNLEKKARENRPSRTEEYRLIALTEQYALQIEQARKEGKPIPMWTGEKIAPDLPPRKPKLPKRPEIKPQDPANEEIPQISLVDDKDAFEEMSLGSFSYSSDIEAKIEAYHARCEAAKQARQQKDWRHFEKQEYIVVRRAKSALSELIRQAGGMYLRGEEDGDSQWSWTSTSDSRSGSEQENPEEEWNRPARGRRATAQPATPFAGPQVQVSIVSPSVYSRATVEEVEEEASKGASLPFFTPPQAAPVARTSVVLVRELIFEPQPETSWLASPTPTRESSPPFRSVASPALVLSRTISLTPQTSPSARTLSLTASPEAPPAAVAQPVSLSTQLSSAIALQTPRPSADGPATELLTLRTAKQLREGVTMSWDGGRSGVLSSVAAVAIKPKGKLEKLKAKFKLFKK